VKFQSNHAIAGYVKKISHAQPCPIRWPNRCVGTI